MADPSREGGGGGRGPSWALRAGSALRAGAPWRAGEGASPASQEGRAMGKGVTRACHDRYWESHSTSMPSSEEI
jgi:hypothetical protein